jgi:hypothetical protein
LHTRACLYGNYVVSVGSGAIENTEFGRLRVEPQKLTYFLPLGLDFGRKIVPGKGEDGSFMSRFAVNLDAKTDRLGFLYSPQRFHELYEGGVRELASVAAAVRYAVHALDDNWYQQVCAVPGLEQFHQPDRRNGRHERAEKIDQSAART